ncbi:MAG: hypothetical protein JSW56_13315 [Deltaproteobacteria bacterium]|nr:MAG: hypothetical protein JSW56_13315 [Deltaproteobacteria bacterium]
MLKAKRAETAQEIVKNSTPCVYLDVQKKEAHLKTLVGVCAIKNLKSVTIFAWKKKNNIPRTKW